MSYRLLDRFRAGFDGQAYLHRRANHGDLVAIELFEDLFRLERSRKLVERVGRRLSVVDPKNKRHGIKARRGDASLGEVVPNTAAKEINGFSVARGSIATIEIGIEVKIIMKAMIKQIDRVCSDLRGQAEHFRSRGGHPLCVGIVGVNHAPYTTTYEGERSFKTDGKKHKHPITEAEEAERRLIRDAAPVFDEFIVLRFRATNEEPFPFECVDGAKTHMDYGSALARLSSEYERRV